MHLGPGTLYGALARLEGQGLIEALPAEGRRRPYRLTAGGAQHARRPAADDRRGRRDRARAPARRRRARMNVPDGRASRRRALGHLLARHLSRTPGGARYGERAAALIDDDPPGVRGAATLLAGACGAHLRPPPQLAASAPRARPHAHVGRRRLHLLGRRLDGGRWLPEGDRGRAVRRAPRSSTCCWPSRATWCSQVRSSVRPRSPSAGCRCSFQALAEAPRRAAPAPRCCLLGLPAAAAACFAGLTVIAVARCRRAPPGRRRPGRWRSALGWQTAGVAVRGGVRARASVSCSRASIRPLVAAPGGDRLRCHWRGHGRDRARAGGVYVARCACGHPQLAAAERRRPVACDRSRPRGWGAALAAVSSALALLAASRARRAAAVV